MQFHHLSYLFMLFCHLSSVRWIHIRLPGTSIKERGAEGSQSHGSYLVLKNLHF